MTFGTVLSQAPIMAPVTRPPGPHLRKGYVGWATEESSIGRRLWLIIRPPTRMTYMAIERVMVAGEQDSFANLTTGTTHRCATRGSTVSGRD